MIKRIDVIANGLKVGTLALTRDNAIAFQYAEECRNVLKLDGSTNKQ